MPIRPVKKKILKVSDRESGKNRIIFIYRMKLYFLSIKLDFRIFLLCPQFRKIMPSDTADSSVPVKLIINFLTWRINNVFLSRNAKTENRLKIDRMMSILVMLLDREKISARELAEKFEVSVRTVYRDIEAINMAGVPIISYSGNGGGFGIMPNYRLDRQYLSLSDMNRILSLLTTVNRAISDSSIESAICKIRNLLPANADAVPFEETSLIDVLPWGITDKASNAAKEISRAISSRKVVLIEYASGKGDSVKREVEPMTIVMKGSSCYLYAYCRLRCGFRIFKISRIKSYAETGEVFERKKKTYNEFIEETPSESGMTEYILRIGSDYPEFAEEYFGGAETERDSSGNYIVKVRLPDNIWNAPWMMSVSPCVEVLHPESARKKIAENASKLLKLYQT